MCRRNWVPAAALLGFGAGVVLSLMCESVLLRLIVGAAAICGGSLLLRTNCRV